LRDREKREEIKMKSSVVIALAAAVLLVAAQYASLADAKGPRVIIVGAGMSGRVVTNNH